MKTAFVNATLYPAEEDPFGGDLIIEDGKIVEFGRELITEGMEIIDCSGLHITPGFIDAHTHTGVWEEGAGPGPGNHDGNEMSDAITPYVRVIDSIHPEDIGFQDARRGGVTTLGIAHGSGNAIGGQFAIAKSYGKEADEMVIKEPAGVKLALGENPKRAGENLGRAPRSRMGIAALIRKAFYEAMDYRDEWEHYEQLVALEAAKTENERKPVKKPKFDIGKDILVKVLNREIPVRNHAHRADDIRTAIRLADEFGYDLCIEHATEGYKIKEILAERQIPLAVGPMIGGRSKRELLHQTQANPGILVKAGANVSIMTDSPFTPVHHLRDSMIIAIREGLPEDKAIRTITINPARLLGIDKRVGSIRAGKDADFVIFDGDPHDARSKVLKTYIDGQLVYKSD